MFSNQAGLAVALDLTVPGESKQKVTFSDTATPSSFNFFMLLDGQDNQCFQQVEEKKSSYGWGLV